MKLSPKMMQALQTLAIYDSASAYRARVPISTMWALVSRNLAVPVRESGSMAFPATANFRITWRGRAELNITGEPR